MKDDLSTKELALIDKKINQNLNDEELNLFEELLQNRQFKQAFEERFQAVAMLRAIDRANLKHELLELEVEDHTKQRFLSSRVWFIAASVPLLAFFGIFYFLNFSGPDSDQIYLTYFRPYKTTLAVRSMDEANESQHWIKDSLFVKASILYSNKEYDRALPIFKQLSSKYATGMLYLYLGNCQLNTGHYQEAIQAFNMVRQKDDSILVRVAEWYMGLTYLKSQDLQHADSVFATIEQKKGVYAKESSEILKLLE